MYIFKIGKRREKNAGTKKRKAKYRKKPAGIVREPKKKDKLYSFHLSLHHLGDLISFHFFFFLFNKDII